MDIRRYQKQDLQSAMNLINIHMAKLSKAMEINCYPEVCSALRAMQEECTNASKVAVTLSLSSHLETPERR